jgi:hypothetical protein
VRPSVKRAKGCPGGRRRDCRADAPSPPPKASRGRGRGKRSWCVGHHKERPTPTAIACRTASSVRFRSNRCT